MRRKSTENTFINWNKPYCSLEAEWALQFLQWQQWGHSLSQAFIMAREVQPHHACIICPQGSGQSVISLSFEKSNLLNEKEGSFIPPGAQIHFSLLSTSLNPGQAQHHMGSMSNGVCRKVVSEFGTNHVTVSVGPSYFSPEHSGFVWFASWSHCIVLCCIHISTSLA